MPKHLEGSLDGQGMKIAIVVARFNEFVTSSLLDGAVKTLSERGLSQFDYQVLWVPGAFEIPGVADQLLSLKKWDAVITLGAVIRGDTPHFDYVCRAATDGVLRASMDRGKPCIFGVLTVDSTEQALERCGEGPGNKGAEAALTAIEMVSLYRKLGDA